MAVSFKWHDGHTALFIETYQKYECLWNPRCSEYKKTNSRERAYASMVADLNMPGVTVADIKAKIKTIRTRYGAELTKIRNSELCGAGADEVYAPRLFWFKDADVFLRSVVCSPREKPNLSSLKNSDTAGKTRSSGRTTDACNYFEELEWQAEDDVMNEISEDSTYPESNGNTSATASKIGDSSQICVKVRKRSPPPLAIQDGMKKPKQQAPDDDNKEHRNEFDVFCESLAIQLGKMPLDRAVICQEKLQSVMTQERLFQLQSCSSMPSFSSTYQQN